MSPSTYVREKHQPRVHFSEYLKTENQPDKDEKPVETTQPAQPKAE